MELSHHLHHSFHVIYRRLWQNAVTQIEDVAGPRARALQQFVDAHLELGQRREQRYRIQIPLDGGTVADVHPGLVDVDTPVDAHYVAARGMQFTEEA